MNLLSKYRIMFLDLNFNVSFEHLSEILLYPTCL